jgi:hypothetical protein
VGRQVDVIFPHVKGRRVVPHEPPLDRQNPKEVVLALDETSHTVFAEGEGTVRGDDFGISVKVFKDGHGGRQIMPPQLTFRWRHGPYLPIKTKNLSFRKTKKWV